jgi:hypothetical protein
MTVEWYPGIRECCEYWSEATMLRQTFEALEKSFEDENDACIDCAKCMVEVVCRVILDELDNPANSHKPVKANPSFGDWMTAAVRVLRLGDSRDASFSKLVSQYHSLTTCLGDLRKQAGPVSHGKPGFIERLSAHHRRSAVLAADAIVAFLHASYLESEVQLAQTKLPYDRFGKLHSSIDRWATMELSSDDDQRHTLIVQIGDEKFELLIEASQLLFHLDRTIYVEALRQGQNLSAQALEEFDALVELPVAAFEGLPVDE